MRSRGSESMPSQRARRVCVSPNFSKIFVENLKQRQACALIFAHSSCAEYLHFPFVHEYHTPRHIVTVMEHVAVDELATPGDKIIVRLQLLIDSLETRDLWTYSTGIRDLEAPRRYGRARSVGIFASVLQNMHADPDRTAPGGGS